MQAEVPFKHFQPGGTSQPLLSHQMSLPVSGQCSHLRSTGFFGAVTVITQLLADAALCSLPLAAFVRWHWILLTLGSCYQLKGLLLGVSFPIQMSAGAFLWTRSCGAQPGGSVWW